MTATVDGERLRRLGRGEPVASLCADEGWSRDGFDAWWADRLGERAAHEPDVGEDSVSEARSDAGAEILRDGRGIPHIFAPTLDEHNKNVVAWRKIEREIRAREAAEAAAKAAEEAAAAAADGNAPTGATPAGEAAAPPAQAAAPATAADPTIAPEVFVDPESLGTTVSPFAEPEATGSEQVPSPQRNPNR